MPTRSSYVICATPRSGSTLLCDLLAETNAAGKPHSFYRRQSIPNWAARWEIAVPEPADDASLNQAYLTAALAAGRGGTGVFGVRLMWESVAELSARLDALFPGLSDEGSRFDRAFGDPIYVHLSRQDKAAQAVSRLRAEQSGLWHRAADGAERERTSAPGVSAYDEDRLVRLWNELEMDDAAWTSWFAAQRLAPLRLTYEAMSAAPHLAVVDVLTALGVDPRLAGAAAPRTAKLADELSREWTDRLRRARSPRPD